jgi:hypothetical protein
MRPRIGAALAVLAGAVFFAPAAHAQAPPDTTGPVITITTPADNDTYTVGQAVLASYGCTDDSGVADCTGPVASGAAVDTSTPGDHTFTVTAHDNATNASTLTHAYRVVAQDDGGAGGDTGATLTLTLGQAPAFAPFIPGVANDYTATMGATVVSTAGDGLLTVADPSTSNPGHLMNGALALPAVLLASATSPNGTSNGFQAINDTANPTSLLTYAGPVSNDPVALRFDQHIGPNDPLRTGSYAKTLTFTLSTTNP